MYFIKREQAQNVEAPVPSIDTTDGPSPPRTSAKIKCDWFKKENTTKHHTDEYKNGYLVLRRGETFKVGVTFEGISFPEILQTILGLTVETTSGELKSTETRCSICEKIDKTKWGMEVIEKNPSGLNVVLKVNIPPDAIVGRYSVKAIVPGSTGRVSLKMDKVAIIFNPWCKDDEVYLDDEEKRKEYVLNDNGTIYQGSSYAGPNGLFSKRWNYGQFEDKVLDCALYLLEKDKRSQRNPLKSLTKRSSSLWVARILSATVNSNDDAGVLVGNWSGNYHDGKSPSSWNGSVAILQQYYNTKTPVRYGQCWVFAGVLTTALRALGIPTRTVTNFDSAHDTDSSMTIDDFYDDKGNLVYITDSSDSVWNFHVWNEIWSKRNDLPGSKYDGWQVVDATPQEASLGLFQLGPAPVKAVKEGEIYAGFDTGFVFGEVNADYIWWTVTKDENGMIVYQKPEYTDYHMAGKYISTKKVGVDEREDITHLYKYEEGSTAERKAFETAYSFGAGAIKWVGHFNVEKEGKDLTLDLKGEPSGIITNGSNFAGIVVIKNTSPKPLTVDVTVVVSSIVYTGQTKHLIKSQKFEKISIAAKESSKIEMPITVQEYIHKMTEHNTMRMVAVAKVLETNKTYIDTCKFQLNNKDRIRVQFSDELKVGKQSEVRVTFENNLPISLSNLVFTIEGAGLTPPVSKKEGLLASGKTKITTFSIKPYKSGNRTLIVDVDSDEVKDFKSFVNVYVQP